MKRPVISWFLVGAQLGLMLAAFIRSASFPIRAGAWVAGAFATGMGIWSIAAMRLSQLHVFPEAKPGLQLRTSGPYAHVRHPMYLSVLLVVLACLVQRPDITNGILVISTTVILTLKAVREEKYLLRIFPEYAAYKTHAGRFLPRIKR